MPSLKRAQRYAIKPAWTFPTEYPIDLTMFAILSAFST